MMFNILIVLNIINLSVASCPYLLNARQKAKTQQNLNLINEKNLRENGFLISEGQPGSQFYTERPIPNAYTDLLYKSELLYRTEQLYSFQYLEKSGKPDDSTIEEKLQNLASLTECLPKEDRCRILNETINPIDFLYRTINGTFNNLRKPLSGASYTGFGRFISATYSDGIDTIRRNAINGDDLPTPRVIGNAIFHNEGNRIIPKQILNTMALYFSQTVGAHDINKLMKTAPKNGGYGRLCCSKDYSEILPTKFLDEACLPMHMPKDDPFYSKYNMTCQTFIRSFKAMDSECKLGSANQMNKQTSYMDNSILYGATYEKSIKLRTFDGGKMKSNKENVLPKDPTSKQYEYLLGDSRNMQTPVTALINSILLRLHNNIADGLSKVNPHWNDEKLYQEARRINIALYQHMYYTEFLPLILGDEYTEKKGLTCKNQTFCGIYNSTIDPSSNSEYTEATFRIFHANIPDVTILYDADYKPYQVIRLDDVINDATLLQTEYLGVLRSGLMQSVKLKGYNQQMRTTVFKNGNTAGVGIDVSSIDIQRGRDHGVAPYYKYMEYCQPNFGKISSWDDLKPNILEKDINTLKTVYNSVWDVDLLIGIYLERQSDYIGPVAKCIIGEQYYRTKFGDRFFYSFNDGHNSFNEDQMKEILNYSFAQMVCQQADLDKVPKNALVIPSHSNPFIKCTAFRQFNFQLWKEEHKHKQSSKKVTSVTPLPSSSSLPSFNSLMSSMLFPSSSDSSESLPI